MKRLLLYFCVVSLVSCAPYYSAPLNNPVTLQHKGDIEADANIALEDAGYSCGGKLALMPLQDFYIRGAFQKGNYSSGSLGSEDDWNTMHYKYGELAIGYKKSAGPATLNVAAFYGIGKHSLNYYHMIQPYPPLYKAVQNARMEQTGVDAAVHLRVYKTLTLIGSCRWNQFVIGDIERTGAFSKMKVFDVPQRVHFVTPMMSFCIIGKYVRLGFHCAQTLSIKSTVPGLSQQTMAASIGVRINYKGIN